MHMVWGTYRHRPLLNDILLKRLIEHIRVNAKSKDIFVDSINGHKDHIHCLVQLNADMCIATAAQLLKGESSYWVNKNQLCLTHFSWASEYYSETISRNQVKNVRHYILLQEEHHRKLSFEEEIKNLELRPG